MNTFEEMVQRAFGFLEERGYSRCDAVSDGDDPRDRITRTRYHKGSHIIDIQLAVGLGLFVYSRVTRHAAPTGCSATDFSSSVYVETLANHVTLPESLQSLRSKTLYDAYNRNALTYQRTIRDKLPAALSYLAAKVQAILDTRQAIE